MAQVVQRRREIMHGQRATERGYVRYDCFAKSLMRKMEMTCHELRN